MADEEKEGGVMLGSAVPFERPGKRQDNHGRIDVGFFRQPSDEEGASGGGLGGVGGVTGCRRRRMSKGRTPRCRPPCLLTKGRTFEGAGEKRGSSEGRRTRLAVRSRWIDCAQSVRIAHAASRLNLVRPKRPAASHRPSLTCNTIASSFHPNSPAPPLN